MSSRVLFAIAAFGASAALVLACAESTDLAGDVSPPPAPGPTFVSDDGGSEAAVSRDASHELCALTDCPAPYATCPPTETSGPVYRCQANLLSDNDNCGACGHPCLVFDGFGVATSCVNGVCVASCSTSDRMDCDGIADNGCETPVSDDPANCGACGKKCAPGDRCIKGKCGCPTGQTECNGKCVDLQRDPANCNACGNECAVPADAGTPPPNMEYTCTGGTCGKLDCLREDYTRWTNCNGVLTDGCEVNLAQSDLKNCGTCGNVCTPGQRCEVVDNSTSPPKYGCVCKPTETMCGEDMAPGFFAGCADLLTSATNCGACGHSCPLAGPHQASTCHLGLCDEVCEPGWGDCNGDERDGCETNLLVDQAHCGACGTRCDAAGGQPCIEGKCLVGECDAGATTR